MRGYKDRYKDKLQYILLLAFMAAFVLIVSKGLLTPQPGDENVYYYMGKLVSEGKTPYKDFFFAHPPLQIYLIALIYKIFGSNIPVLKSIPLLSTLLSAFLIFKIAKERFGNAEAVLSSLLFLFSYSIMFNSVFSFGIDAATMLFLVGFYLLRDKNKSCLAGLFFALAGITRLLSLLPVFIIFIWAWLSNKKDFIRLLSVFLIAFLAANGIFAISFGDNYLIPVYKFHFLKSFSGRENFREYTDIIKLNWILFSSALLMPFAKKKKRISIFAAISVAYLLFLAALKKVFGFYFIPVFPFLAIIGSYSIANIFRAVNLQKRWKVFIAAALLAAFAWNLASDILFLEKIGFTGFERGKDIAEFISSNSNNGTLLFGDDSVAPLLAMMMNKSIALDFVDTNEQIFISGVKKLDKVLADLKGKDIMFVIRSKQGISYFSEVKYFLNRNCEFLAKFHDKIEGDYLIYRCTT